MDLAIPDVVTHTPKPARHIGDMTHLIVGPVVPSHAVCLDARYIDGEENVPAHRGGFRDVFE